MTPRGIKPIIRTVSVPVLDTGLGRRLGYEDDADLIAHAEAERAKLDPATQEVMREIDRRIDDVILYGRAHR